MKVRVKITNDIPDTSFRAGDVVVVNWRVALQLVFYKKATYVTEKQTKKK